ncbi:MAG: hypothetical protein IPJ82_24955 [Lewinellaceae bacterium]|nr:hypothetical protein [Lewinellaceae bacterium]
MLVIACISYVNLATARATTPRESRRTQSHRREGKSELFTQFLAESGLLILVATGVGDVALPWLFSPCSTNFHGKNFSSRLFLQPVVLRVVTGLRTPVKLAPGGYLRH